ncbi:endolytic transglycosylase MltG, partial [Modestobacter versicolor]
VTRLPAGHPSEPLPELATEVHAAVGADRFDDVEDDHGWQAASARHRGEFDDEPEHHEHVDAHPHEEHDDHLHDDHLHDDHAAGSMVFDETGGLEVVVIDDHDDHDGHDGGSGGGGGRGRRGGRGGRGGGSGRRRKRRGPITIVLSLLVLVGLVAGIGIGGKALWDQLNPVAEDYTGTGTGEVDVRVEEGDSLRAIAATLVDADVIASSDPFEEAADANPAATGIQPGVYRLRSQMSGQAALDLLLDPASRQVSKVTIPEGLTQVQILDRLAEQTGMPLADLQAAAADTAALGLPPYANGVLEGWLFPATYDIEPGDTPATVLSEMVAGAVRVLDELQVPEAERLAVLTEASIVQAEAGSVEDMGMVARVLDNRLAIGMPLQLDTTVNYANGKSGVTTTAEDRANPSPYNTYANPGLPPGAISNPGEDALRAVQNPTPGDWLFFVVVDPDTGETRFAATKEEHDANVLLFQQWLRDNPGN